MPIEVNDNSPIGQGWWKVNFRPSLKYGTYELVTNTGKVLGKVNMFQGFISGYVGERLVDSARYYDNYGKAQPKQLDRVKRCVYITALAGKEVGSEKV